MQRLFSMFPTGRPGFALLLMRIALGVMLLDSVSAPILHLGSLWYLVAPGAVALALLIGFITPIASVSCVILEATIWITASGAIESVHICAVLVGVALALLGPGAYSLDARLFGRRQVIVRSDDDTRRQ